VWNATGKAQQAQECMTEVVHTTDGVMMTHNLNVVMMGLTEMEAMTTMPLLGSHLLKRSNNEDTEDDGQLGLQCFHHIPLKCVFGPETKDVIENNFKPKYDIT